MRINLIVLILLGLSSSSHALKGSIQIPSNRSPIGSAGGDLGGSYPNPTVNQSTNLGGFLVSPGSFTVGGSTLVVNNGNVGIGTTNPLANLDVNGSSILRSSVTAIGTMTVQGVAFSVGTSTLVVSNGNIGFRTTSPSTSTTVTVYGLSVSSTVMPTGSCNAGTIIINAESNSMSGEFTAGAGAANCTLTFSAPFPKKPKCWCNDETNIVVVRATPTTSTLKCDVAIAFGSDVIQYACSGSP